PAGETPDATADLEHGVGRLHARAERFEQPVEVALTLRPEPRQVGIAVVEPVVHEEERVLFGPLVPEAPHLRRHSWAQGTCARGAGRRSGRWRRTRAHHSRSEYGGSSASTPVTSPTTCAGAPTAIE